MSLVFHDCNVKNIMLNIQLNLKILTLAHIFDMYNL